MNHMSSALTLFCCVVGFFLPWTCGPVFALQMAPENLSLDMKGALAVDVLKIIAQRGNVQMVVSGAGRNRQVSLVMKDAPPDTVIQEVARLAGFEQIGAAGVVVLTDPGVTASFSTDIRSGDITATATISMDFREAAVTDLFKLIEKRCGLTVHVGRGVQGRVACRFSDIDPSAAVQGLAAAIGARVTSSLNAFAVAVVDEVPEGR